jgi:hypothetical protein
MENLLSDCPQSLGCLAFPWGNASPDGSRRSASNATLGQCIGKFAKINITKYSYRAWCKAVP